MSTDAPKPERLLSLDVMRGATIMAMILVNNPGTWGAMYWPLGHADWHGWTPTDLIFPFFVFMVGVAMAYSLTKYTTGDSRPTAALYLRIARRVLLLILLGLFLAASGWFCKLLIGRFEPWDGSTLRWPGVLQRIALAYLGASLVVLWLRGNWQVVAAGVLLLGYSAMLWFLPQGTPLEERFSPTGNVVRQVDLALIGPNHMWTRATSEPTDPEGLLSTLPAIVTALAGYWVGLFVRAAPVDGGRVGRLALGGTVVAGLGIVWDLVPLASHGMPINKALWTPSFVLLTAGLGMVALAACLAMFDVLGRGKPWAARLALPFQMVGVNAIFVFVMSGFVARLLGTLRVGEQSLQSWLYQNAFVEPLAAVGLSDPRLASLGFALATVGVWWLVLAAMWSRGWSVRV
jgi:predicted acyltransferase